jgi:hypothetical protein
MSGVILIPEVWRIKTVFIIPNRGFAVVATLLVTLAVVLFAS